MSFQIAIDGPVAAGKSTVSKQVADRLGFLYVDTGAMYRMAALLAYRQRIDYHYQLKIVELIRSAEMQMRPPIEAEKDGRLSTIILNGEDVSWLIRTEEISYGASEIAKLPKVRAILVDKQQLIVNRQSVVMEGRDITTKVLPRANLKIYLTADEPTRAERRHQQLLSRGEDISLEEVTHQLIIRDREDSHRLADPLQITDGVWVVDTSHLTIDEVVDAVEKKVKSMITS